MNDCTEVPENVGHLRCIDTFQATSQFSDQWARHSHYCFNTRFWRKQTILMCFQRVFIVADK